ncbi:hypothetical protein ACB094_11G040700 [Castanea mollissima]
MVKFLKPNKAVVLLQGRFAGHKAVIVRNFDDGNRDRPYGHCLVAGLAKYPKKVIRKDSAKKTAKKSRVKAFLKVVNYSHIMPTRYTLDVDLKDIVSVDALQSRDKKVTAAKETKARFEDRFKSGKNRWFFSKLSYQSASRHQAPSPLTLPTPSEMALRGASQLQKLVLSFSDLGGSSRGIRAFMESHLPAFGEKNPQLDVVTQLIHGNKNERVICVKNMDPEDVLVHATRLKNSLGRKIVKLKTRHVAKHPIVQGTWTTDLKF